MSDDIDSSGMSAAEIVKPIVPSTALEKAMEEVNDAAKKLIVGPFPAAPLAAVAALPSKDDPAKLEVQYCLAQAIAADFVEVIVIGTRAKKDGGGFTWFGSSQEVLRAIAMMEVAKAEMVRAQLGSTTPNAKPPGAA